MTKRKETTPVKSYAPSGNGAGPVLDVEININALTWEDLYTVTSIGKDTPFSKETVGEIRALFNRVVVGGAAAVPVIHTQAVIEQIGAALQALANPKNSSSA